MPEHLPALYPDEPFLQGGGEMGELIRSVNWAANPLGPPDSWPAALKHAVSTMLKNNFPVLICWGPDYIQLYNDAFRPINGESKHPQAMGGSARDTYAEIWETIGPMFSEVMQGKTHGFPNFMVPLHRNGYTENCYFDFSYSPIADLEVNIHGVLVICMETTEKVAAIELAKKAQSQTIIERDRLKQFFLQAPAGICILDGPELTFELVNPLYQQLFPGRGLLGKPLLEAVPEVRGSAIWEILQGVYQTGKTFEGNELLIPLARTTDGPVEDRYFNFIYQARTDTTGVIDGILVFVIEVTDMVLVKQRVIENERELEQMLNLLPAHVVVIRGKEQVVEMVNDSNLAYWGKTKAQALGKPLLEVLPELADQPFPGQLNQVMETGEVISVKESIVTFIEPDGSERITYVDYSYQPLMDASGERNGVLVMSFEVTDKVKSRKLLEQFANDLQALNEESSAVNEELAATNEELLTTQQQLELSFSELANSESRFKFLIQGAPVAIGVLHGRELVIESANELLLQIWGKSKNVIGMQLADALPEIQGQPFLGLLDNVYTTGEPFYGNEVLAKLEHDGELRDIYLNFVYQPIIGEAGHASDIIAVATEVTEQVIARKKVERAEESLRMAIEAAGLGSYFINVIDRIFYPSPKLKEFFGFGPDEEVPYEAAINQIHPDYRQQAADLVEAAITKGVTFDMEYPIIGHNDGKIRWVRGIGTVQQDDQGVNRYFTGVLHEITEQREDEIRKNDFIGMVSHELKTPLTSLTAIVQVANQKLKSSEDGFLASAMEKASVQVKRMSNMINGFLNVSRLESAKLVIDKGEFNLEELIEETIKETELTVSSHIFKFEPCIPVMVRADHDKIGSVITNLISNAVKYSPKGKEIDIKCEVIGDRAQVSVKDEGLGLKPQDKDRVFERYYRVETNHTQHISGFGIGLYLSAEIIHRHGGEIWVESEIGKGSVFYFSLPL
jgi:two-component system sensor histidine kinase VicK